MTEVTRERLEAALRELKEKYAKMKEQDSKNMKMSDSYSGYHEYRKDRDRFTRLQADLQNFFMSNVDEIMAALAASVAEPPPCECGCCREVTSQNAAGRQVLVFCHCFEYADEEQCDCPNCLQARAVAEKAPAPRYQVCGCGHKLIDHEGWGRTSMGITQPGLDYKKCSKCSCREAHNVVFTDAAEKAAPAAPPHVEFDKFLELLREFHDIQNKGISYIGAAARFYNAALAGVAQEAGETVLPGGSYSIQSTPDPEHRTTAWQPNLAAASPLNAPLKFRHDHENLCEFITHLSKATDYDTHDAGHVIDCYWRDEAAEWVKEFEAGFAQANPLNADEIVEACAKIADDEWELDKNTPCEEGHREFRKKYGTVEINEAIRALKGRFTLAAPQVREETKK
jgi:hypothetical protein